MPIFYWCLVFFGTVVLQVLLFKYQQIIHVLFNEFNVACSSCSNQMIVSHDERNPQAPMACTDNDCFLPDGRDPSPRKKT